jgi:FixJ family two-component response regulator
MTEVIAIRSERLTLHYVGGDVHERACFAQTALLLEHHCELYDNLNELAAHPPRRGIIFLHDDPAFGGIPAGFERLEGLGIWLPVIAIGEAPSPRKIVEAIKAGALDYIVLPVQAERLDRCLARNALEAQRNATLRRKKVEAQERLARLSRREAEVLDLLANGCSNKLIARELGISPRTVEIHRSNMINKIGASNSAGALRLKLEAYGP